jgi:hypothetical protein
MHTAEIFNSLFILSIHLHNSTNHNKITQFQYYRIFLTDALNFPHKIKILRSNVNQAFHGVATNYQLNIYSSPVVGRLKYSLSNVARLPAHPNIFFLLFFKISTVKLTDVFKFCLCYQHKKILKTREFEFCGNSIQQK